MSSTPFERRSFAGGASLARLVAQITSSATAIAVDTVAGWDDGTAGPFYVTIDRGLAAEERVRVVSLSATVLNLGSTSDRGVDGTNPQSHAAGATVEVTTSAIDADEANYTVTQTVGQVQTKGDLLPGTATNTVGRLAVGTDAQILLADATTSTGLRWGPLPAASISSSTQFATGVVDANALAASAVTSSALGAGSVTSAAIADGTIATGDLADASVTAAKLASGALNYSNLPVFSALPYFALPTIPVYTSETAPGRTVADMTTNSTTTITSATAAFASTDIGETVSGTDIPSGAYITAVASGTSATISAAATGSHSSGSLTIGAVPTGQLWLKPTLSRLSRWSGTAWVIQANGPYLHYTSSSSANIATATATNVGSWSLSERTDAWTANGTTFTVPTAADSVYNIDSGFRWASGGASDATARYIFAVVNSTTYVLDDRAANPNGARNCAGALDIRLAAGDVVTIQVQQNSGGGVALAPSFQNHYVKIRWVRP